MTGKPVELTDKDFKKKVLDSKIPVLVCFSSSSSACRILEPHMTSLADEWKGQIAVKKLDVNLYSSVAREFSISSCPTLILFKKGNIVERIVGLKSHDVIKAQLERHIL